LLVGWLNAKLKVDIGTSCVRGQAWATGSRIAHLPQMHRNWYRAGTRSALDLAWRHADARNDRHAACVHRRLRAIL